MRRWTAKGDLVKAEVTSVHIRSPRREILNVPRRPNK